MSISINRRLNLVVPIERDAGTIYLHATPISFEVFKPFDLVLSKACQGLLEMDLGPMVAMSMLERVATASREWENVQSRLMPEIERLTMVIVPGEAPIPYNVAVSRDLLDAEDIREGMGAVVFFTLVSLACKRSQVAAKLADAGKTFDFATISSNSTEFSASLRTSTPAATSGETATESQHPR